MAIINTNVRPSDLATLLGAIAPQSASGVVSSAWIDASRFHAFEAIVLAGTLGAGATVDAKLRQATDASGTGAKDITGKAISQVTASNRQALINLRPEELDVAGGFRYVQLQITVGVAASQVAGLVQGFGARYGPAAHMANTEVK
ncbi:MAG TPA: hypothetical protein VNI83_04645 [Vicinamibacterales bacterium]|nr:hypothetical protein [Vicinamibacterales bacterium]